jgi:hypothetical protein
MPMIKTNHRKILLTIAISIGHLTNHFTLFAQPLLKTKQEVFDFGEIYEGDAAEHEFIIFNEGTEPLIISKVDVSCGCTTPTWTNTPIAPKSQGIVKVAYGTKGRVGAFNKNITVTTNASNQPISVFYIRGVVEPKQITQTPTTEELRFSPKLVLDKDKHYFGTIEKNSKQVLQLTVKNLGRSDLKINAITAGCNCVRFELNKPFIASGDSGILKLYYTPSEMNEITNLIQIKTNDISHPSVKFALSAKVVESLVPRSLVKEQNIFVPFK